MGEAPVHHRNAQQLVLDQEQQRIRVTEQAQRNLEHTNARQCALRDFINSVPSADPHRRCDGFGSYYDVVDSAFENTTLAGFWMRARLQAPLAGFECDPDAVRLNGQRPAGLHPQV